MPGPLLDSLAAGLPVLLVHLLTALAMLLASLLLYMIVTPHKEIALVRAGNVSAALSLGAAALGLALPLAVCLYASLSLWDIVMWGTVALVLQLVLFTLVDLLLRDLPARIVRDERASATLLALIKISVAVLLSAALAT